MSEAIPRTRKRTRPSCSLWDLPDAAINMIAACLSEPDKNSFMATCKRAVQITLLTAEISIGVTKPTKFAGLRQILDQLPTKIHLHVVFPSFEDDDVQPAFDKPLAALAVFMGMVPDKFLTQVASNCHWAGITRITVHVSSMHGKHVELPAEYHSPAQIHHSLPNIDTLLFSHRPNAALIETFATQLTRLVIDGFDTPAPALIRQCSNLQHLSTYDLLLPDNTAALRLLELGCSDLFDYDISKLLQLPSLGTLRCTTFSDIQQDWTGHACSWQELQFVVLPDFTTFAKFNLNNLKRLVMVGDQSIILPDPSNPDSIAAVQRAADNLAGIDRAVMVPQETGGGVYFGECGALSWGVPESGSEHEQAAAELIRIAAQRISPARVCSIDELLQRPLLLNEVLNWGRTFIESVCLGEDYDPQPYVWQALQQLDKLHTLVFWDLNQDAYDSWNQEHAQVMLKISSTVCTAAQQYVVPTNRRLRMEFGVSFGRYNSKDLAEEVKETLVKEAPRYLEAALRQVLPTSCKVASIELCSGLDCDNWTYYGEACCNISDFWVVIIEPSLSTA